MWKALPEIATESVTLIEKRSADMADPSQKAVLALWCARIYERAGFTLVEEERHRSFGHDLVGQNWSLALRDH